MRQGSRSCGLTAVERAACKALLAGEVLAPGRTFDTFLRLGWIDAEGRATRLGLAFAAMA